MLKVYNPEDKSFIEYYSHDISEFDHIERKSAEVCQYSKFFNSHYELVNKIEETVTKHGHPNSLLENGDLNFIEDLEKQIDGINSIQLFSLTKKM